MQNKLDFFIYFFTGIPLVIVSLVLAIDINAYGGRVPEEVALVLQSNDSL